MLYLFQVQFHNLVYPCIPRVYYLMIINGLSVFFCWLVYNTVNKKIKLRPLELGLLIISPIIFYIVVYIGSGIIPFFYLGDKVGLFYISTIMLIVLFFSFYCMLYRIGKNNLEKEKRLLYQQMVDYEQKKYSDIENNLEQIKKIRHDIKHELTLIKLKIDNNDLDGSKELMNQIFDNVSTAGSIINTDSPVVDYIINTKLNTLNNASVIVNAEKEVLKKFDDMDLSVIFGNIIDNTVEAVANQENPKIELSIFSKDNYINIVCKNSIIDSILSTNPDLHTTKSDTKKHGLGLRSVKETINKLNGDISFTENDNMFIVHIMIPIL